MLLINFIRKALEDKKGKVQTI